MLSAEVIRLQNVSKAYLMGDTWLWAINQVNLSIREGELLSIMGPSGSGKSTTMNILGCLDQPTEGSYQLLGNETAHMGDDELAEVRNKLIGFVFQSFNLLARQTALENVELPMIYAGVPAKERRERALGALEQVGLTERMHHRPQELSGGQQQRVAIARSLVNAPAIILADEPTGNLDSRSGEEIIEIFQRLNEQGATIILVTHEEEIAAHTKRIVRFRDGRIISDERVLKPRKAVDVMLERRNAEAHT